MVSKENFYKLFEKAEDLVIENKILISSLILTCGIKYIQKSWQYNTYSTVCLHGTGIIKIVDKRLYVDYPTKPLSDWLWDNKFIKEENVWNLQKLLFQQI